LYISDYALFGSTYDDLGTYGAIEVFPCPEGSFTDKPGMTSCQLCPAGYESNPEHTGCIACKGKSYNNKEGQGCKACPDGSSSHDQKCFLDSFVHKNNPKPVGEEDFYVYSTKAFDTGDSDDQEESYW
jgi:hypothetical protein